MRHGEGRDLRPEEDGHAPESRPAQGQVSRIRRSGGGRSSRPGSASGTNETATQSASSPQDVQLRPDAVNASAQVSPHVPTSDNYSR